VADVPPPVAVDAPTAVLADDVPLPAPSARRKTRPERQQCRWSIFLDDPIYLVKIPVR
jgi:hypothetical protein